MAEASVIEAIYSTRYQTGDSVKQLTLARQAAEQLVDSTVKLATSEERLSKSSLNRLGALDPRIKAEQVAAAHLDHFSRLHADGAITNERYASTLRLIEGNLKTKTTAMDGAASTTARLGDRIGALVTRYVGLIAIMNAARRLAQEAIRTDAEAAAAADRLGESYSRLAQNAGPAIAWLTDRLTDLVDHTNNVVKGIKDAVAEIGRAPILGGIGNRLPNSPMAPGFNLSMSMDPKTRNWTGGAQGFPTSGFTDLTANADKAAKAEQEALKLIEQEAEAVFKLSQVRAEMWEENRIAQDKATKAFADANVKAIGAIVDRGIAQEVQNAKNLQGIIRLNEEVDNLRQDSGKKYDDEAARSRQKALDLEIEAADRLRMSLIEVGTAGLYGFKSLGDAASRFLEQMAILIFQMKVLKPIIESIGGSFGTSGGGGIFGTIASVIAGALGSSGSVAGGAGTWGGPQAAGGPVSGGTSYLVGERGPELFTPRSAGTITPNHQMGGGGTVINIDARGSTLSEAQIEAAFMRSVQASVGISLGTIAKNRKDTGRG